jgi:hypothetical protein
MLWNKIFSTASNPPVNVLYDYRDSANFSITRGEFDSDSTLYCSGVDGTSDFVAKINANGVMEWRRRFQLALFDNISGFTLDESENPVILGVGRESGSFNSAILVKYNQSGVLQWQRKLSKAGASMQGLGGVRVAASGNIYIACQHAVSGAATVHVVKYNSSGTLQWQRDISLTSNNFFPGTQSVYLDSSENFYVGFRNNIANPDIAYVVKYNSSGTLQWQKQITISGVDAYVATMTGDSSGVYCATTVSSSATPNILHIDSSGAKVWEQAFSGMAGASNISALRIADDGDLLISIQRNTTTFNNWIVKADSGTGSIQWQYVITGSASSNSDYPAVQLLGDDLSFAGRQNNPASTLRGAFFRVSASSGAGNYSNLTLASGGLTTSTPTHTVGDSSLTDATGTLTDAAGDMTDSAMTTLTATVYQKV